MPLDAAIPISRMAWRVLEGAEFGERQVAEETPVAIVHDGSTTAVMMATPADLEDFGLGFSLSEGLIETAADVRDLEIAESELGIEVRLWLVQERASHLAARRRHLAGPTGCGLCGIDSLGEAIKSPKKILDSGYKVTPQILLQAMDALNSAQPIGRSTRAVHAAALWRDGAIQAAREDVGRHNALDKLVGATVRMGGGALGLLLLTSRVSVEMVQKAAALGAPILCAVSAPTALAIHTAEAAGITLVGVARQDGFEIFTHPDRIEIDV